MIRRVASLVPILAGSMLAGAMGLACAGESPPPPGVAPSRAEPNAPAPETQEEGAAALRETPTESPPAAPELGPFALGTRVGKVETFGIPGDRTVRLAHAPEHEARAIVYLHGMCSDTTAAEPWFPEAARYGTVIALRADVPCDDRPGFKWPKDPALLEARIARALERVKEERGGRLDLERPALIGYSQGAHRSELLTAAYPGRYRRVVLGGPPEAALAEHFQGVERVAFLGGEKEDTSHMVRGAANLAESGIATRFFLLPRAPHGSFGPRGNEVMRETLAWVFSNER